MSSTNFDDFSSNYKQLLDRSVAVAGESGDYFAEYKASYLARVAGHDFSGKILDYGCGVGLLSGVLKKHLPHASIHGYDVSDGSIRRVAPHLAAQGVFSSDLSCLHSDYELAVISNVMHHVPSKDRQATIVTISRRLAARGRLILFEHNPLNPLTQWVVKHCPFDDDAVLLRPREAARYFAGAGLSIARRDYIVFFPRMLSFFRAAEPRLGWLPAGGQYALIGEKHGE